MSEIAVELKSHRLLGEGEVVLATDEFFHAEMEQWLPVASTAGEKYMVHWSPIRRETAASYLLAALKAVLYDIESLQQNSEGVAGLHKNGDIADWNWLEQGWLSTDHLREAITRAEGGPQ